MNAEKTAQELENAAATVAPGAPQEPQDAPVVDKRPVGRPRKFKDAKQLSDALDKYFAECDSRMVEVVTNSGKVVKVKKPAPYTIMGLCRVLDIDRLTLLEYGNGMHDKSDPEFSNTIKEAKQKVSEFHEKLLYEGQNQAGAIFTLKNNAGWRDKSEQELTGAVGSYTVETMNYKGAAKLDGPSPD